MGADPAAIRALAERRRRPGLGARAHLPRAARAALQATEGNELRMKRQPRIHPFPVLRFRDYQYLGFRARSSEGQAGRVVTWSVVCDAVPWAPCRPQGYRAARRP